MANKKKIATSVAAVAMAAAMLLGGTFAWQSISQTALNEASDIVNPGGRLHDDFNGENKDVYVENFADEPIFARVRLGEYMEIVVNKGMGDNLEKTVEVIGSRNFDEDGNVESYNYDVFKNYESDGEFNAGVDKTDPDKSWWTWTTGGSTVYMPTFNLNKDSLEADVNGTLQGPDGMVTDAEDDDRYSDYVTYEDGETLEGLEIYDADSNNIDEVGDNFDNLTQYEIAGNIVTISADEDGDPISHTAKPTGTAQLISMEEWLAMNPDAAAATAADDPYGIAPAFAENAVATLHYDKNAEDAVGSIADVEMPYDSELTLSDGTGFTREGYTLVGWNTQLDGLGEAYELGATFTLPEGETTLYAVWELDDGTGGGTDDEDTQDDEPAYWVYDTDGWVYYSKPIEPHTATGLLLSGIKLNEVMDDSWYYAIQVTGQFITADDLGSMEDGTGFYDTAKGSIPTDNALKLLEHIGVEVPENGTTDGEEEIVAVGYALAVTETTSTTYQSTGCFSPGDTATFDIVTVMSDGSQVAASETEGMTITCSYEKLGEVSTEEKAAFDADAKTVTIPEAAGPHYFVLSLTAANGDLLNEFEGYIWTENSSFGVMLIGEGESVFEEGIVYIGEELTVLPYVLDVETGEAILLSNGETCDATLVCPDGTEKELNAMDTISFKEEEMGNYALKGETQTFGGRTFEQGFQVIDSLSCYVPSVTTGDGDPVEVKTYANGSPAVMVDEYLIDGEFPQSFIVTINDKYSAKFTSRFENVVITNPDGSEYDGSGTKSVKVTLNSAESSETRTIDDIEYINLWLRIANTENDSDYYYLDFLCNPTP